jgi:VanZ family protein
LSGATPQQLNTLTPVFSVPGRAFQVIDLFIDFLGVIVGVFVYTKIKNRTAKAQRHEDFKV